MFCVETSHLVHVTVSSFFRLVSDTVKLAADSIITSVCFRCLLCLRWNNFCDYELWSDYEKAGELAKEYSAAKGPGTTVKPQNHLFFRKLSPIVQRTLDKCVRENGFM